MTRYKNAALHLAPAICALLLIYCRYLKFYLSYFPYGDDPAILHGSAQSPINWFIHGFSTYFIVYPEWTVPFTDFMRPGVNLIVRLSQLIFGSHFALYFASYYAAQLWLCAIAIALAAYFRVPSRWLWLVGLVTAINPAFVGYGLVRISHQFDVWCGVFTLLSFLLVMRRSYLLALTALTLAVFTKEPALYAPIAASLTVYLETRRKSITALMLTPLAAWIVVRTTIFSGSFGGIYAVRVSEKPALALTVLKGLLMWPTGLGTYSNHLRDVLTTPKTTLIVVANQLIWIFFAAILIQAARAAVSSSFKDDYSRASLTLLIWLCGALSFGVLAAHDPRFGGSIYPLEVVFSAVMLSRSPTQIGKQLAQFALAIFTLAFAWNARQILLSLPLHQSDGMGKLVDSIRANANSSKTIYVLNSAESYSAPDSIAALARKSSTLIILDQFDGCASSSNGSILVQPAGNALHIRSVLPHCAEYVFDGTPNSTMIHLMSGAPARGDYAVYHFPEGHATDSDSTGTKVSSIDFGRELDISLNPPEDVPYILLYYDWATQKYRCFGKSCAVAYR